MSRTATEEEKEFINTLASTRRMKRDVGKLMELYNGNFGLPFKPELTEQQKSLIKKLESDGLTITVKTNDNRTPEQIYGYMGEYFAKDDGQSGQSSDKSILDYNSASGEIGWNDYNGDWNLREQKLKELNADKIKQPGLWLQWRLNDEGTELEWDGGEKFYNYIEWLEYLIVHFFEPWGIKLNGEIEWIGEESNDRGKIVVTDNNVEVYNAIIGYEKRGD